MEDHDLNVWFNGLEYFVATSADQAEKMLCEMYDKETREHEAVVPWEIIDNNHNLTVDFSEGEGSSIKTMKAIEWCSTNGVGYLCSVDF